MALLSRSTLPKMLSLSLKQQMYTSEKDPVAPLTGTHSAHLGQNMPTISQRKQIVRYAMQMNPRNDAGDRGLDDDAASASDNNSAASFSPYRHIEGEGFI